jgi:hypothetical protein
VIESIFPGHLGCGKRNRNHGGTPIYTKKTDEYGIRIILEIGVPLHIKYGKVD